MKGLELSWSLGGPIEEGCRSARDARSSPASPVVRAGDGCDWLDVATSIAESFDISREAFEEELDGEHQVVARVVLSVDYAVPVEVAGHAHLRRIEVLAQLSVDDGKAHFSNEPVGVCGARSQPLGLETEARARACAAWIVASDIVVAREDECACLAAQGLHQGPGGGQGDRFLSVDRPQLDGCGECVDEHPRRDQEDREDDEDFDQREASPMPG